jgi:hypothetical protein
MAEQLWGVSPVLRGDVVLMASNSGVNGSISSAPLSRSSKTAIR